MPYILEEITKFHQCRPARSDKKTTFNHEYTPILERYFEYNAYPTLPDHRMLARKSLMTPRQIEVWFQNHRNRAKKEGIILKRLTSHISSTFSLNDLEAKIPHFMLSKRDRSKTLQSDSSEDEGSDEVVAMPPTPSTSTIITSNRPPHAFPTKISASRDTDAFPKQNGTFKFPPPIWQRHPTATPMKKPSINVDKLATMFATKLDLRGAPVKSFKAFKPTKPLIDIQKWFASTITKLPRAPHPAFVRTRHKPTPSLASIPRDYNPQTWQSTSVPLRRTSNFYLPRCLPSWSTSNHQSSPRRKTPGLPRCSPTSMRSCMSSQSYHQTPTSRFSSLTSISSADSGTSTISSDSSFTSDSSGSEFTESSAELGSPHPPDASERYIPNVAIAEESALDFGGIYGRSQDPRFASFDPSANDLETFLSQNFSSKDIASLSTFDLTSLCPLPTFNLADF